MNNIELNDQQRDWLVELLASYDDGEPLSKFSIQMLHSILKALKDNQ